MGIQSNGEYLMAWPLSQHILTAGYFYSDGSVHRAIDMRTNYNGTTYQNVMNAFDGIVKEIHTWDGKTKTGTESYGNYILIEHVNYKGKSLCTRYAHLSQILVSVGQRVKEGELIGVSGSTGNVTGPHLHFEVILNGSRVNPLVWLDDNFTKAYSYVYTYRDGEHAVDAIDDKKSFIVAEADSAELYEVKVTCTSDVAYNKVISMAKDMQLPFYFKVSSGDYQKFINTKFDGMKVE